MRATPKRSNKILSTCPQRSITICKNDLFRAHHRITVENNRNHIYPVIFPKHTSLKDGRIPNRSTNITYLQQW
uniref:Uncharacterized protein n=1 Tax=Schistosoma japonicum TaxID=6182 RepID=C7TYU1_SCHJA|nr:hypothetical protein [Schistosoma japonicum]